MREERNLRAVLFASLGAQEMGTPPPAPRGAGASIFFLPVGSMVGVG